MKTQLISLSSGFQAAVHQTGSGPPLLCLSGFAGSHFYFLPMIPYLSPNFSLILLDNRGMGASSPAAEPYAVTDLASDALEVMTALDHERFAVLSLCMGGLIAQEVAKAAPERVSALTLLATLGSTGEDLDFLIDITTEVFSSFYQGKVIRDKERFAASMMVSPRYLNHHPEGFEDIVQLLRDHPEQLDQVLYQLQAVRDYLGRRQSVDEITCPTALYAGAEDAFIYPRWSRALHHRIAGSAFEVLPDTGHFFFLEKAEETCKRVAAFLSNPKNDAR